jgi:hypothetical protein
MRKYLVTAAITAIAAVLLAAPALAGKGGKPGSSAASTATLSATTTSAGGNVYLSGCGYQVAPATIAITQPDGTTMSYGVGVWSTGCLDTAYFVASQAGTYQIAVSQSNNSGPAASTSVTVS